MTSLPRRDIDIRPVEKLIDSSKIANRVAQLGRQITRDYHGKDLVVIGVLVFFVVQPWVSIDATTRLLIGAIAFILIFVWFYTDFAEQRTRAERKAEQAAQRAARGPRDSTEIGRQAGRAVGGAARSVKRWKDGLAGEGASEQPQPASWDPPTPPE